MRSAQKFSGVFLDDARIGLMLHRGMAPNEADTVVLIPEGWVGKAPPARTGQFAR